MAEGFAGALMFISMLLLLVILGFLVLSQAAQAFFTTIEQTAAGSEEVTWPDEPLIDRFGKPFYLVFVLGVYLVPVYFAARAVSPGFKFAAYIPPGAEFVTMWLVVPVGVLSVLSAANWVPLRWAIIDEVFRLPGTWLVYYALNFLVLAAVAALVVEFLVIGRAFLALLVGPALAALWLIYARLLGRVARLIRPPPEPEPTEKGPKKSAGREPRAPTVRSEAADPWAVPTPATAEDEYLAGRSPREEAYDIQTAPPAEPAPTPTVARDESYDIESGNPAPIASPVVPTPPRHRRRPGRETPPDDDDDDEDLGPPRHPVGPPPTVSSLWTGVFGYPWQRGSLRAWLSLSAGGALWLAVFQAARSALPG